MNFEKLESRIISLILISLIYLPLSSQDKVFTLQSNADNRIVINKDVSGNIQLNPFQSKKPIGGLAISCDITFNSDTSMVRIILVDEHYNEYLVCETYPLLNESNTFSLNDYAEETSYLLNVIPLILEIEVVNASVSLKEITTCKEEKLITKATIDRSLQQNLGKIKIINEQIRKKGGLWIAGETSVSKLPYKEKKELFGGRVPNLQGFEYYIGGIFAMPGALESEINVQALAEKFSLNNASPFADEFSWRNRHGQDWVTPVKNQAGCGSCWAFAAIGATELLVNLYYNRHLDMDLSEQDAVSCFGSLSGSCAGGDAGATLDYIRDFGVVPETCFPYAGWDEPCVDKCTNPSEIIKIGGREYSQWLTDSIAKERIIEGPVSCAISSWAHITTLVGYKVIRGGDNIFNIIIPSGHPYVGRTVWLLKNSWGEDWGDNGYVYTLSNVDNLRFYELFPPVSSLNINESDIACQDEDSDGYYNWGIGPKPPHCPPCPDEADGDDSNSCLGPMDKFGNIRFFTEIPTARDTSVLAGDIVPELKAMGENIRWYGDKNRESLLSMGNSFLTGQSTPGKYTYYVTQTLSGCESDIISVKLIIHLNVLPPIAEDVTIFTGEQTPTLLASGDNLKWYADPKNPFYDSRDGQIYETTLIGNQLWMAENLNFYTSTGSFYYDNDSSLFANTYGRLYDITALGSCPFDLKWHLPSDEEWIELEMKLGMNKEEAYIQAPRGAGIGGKLKETGTLHWESPNADATNEVGFNALPAGTHEDMFSGIQTTTGFFASAEYYPNAVYLRTLDIYSDKISRSILNNYSRSAYSIRCVLNPSEPVALGNSYKPVYVLPGKYIYYVTQTILGFESPADTIIYNILSEVPMPEVTDVTVCENNQVPDLVAAGKNIKWYSDASLSHLLYSGNSYSSGKTLHGEYAYYVTQSVGERVSKADTVSLTIVPVTPGPFTQDVSVCYNQLVPDLIAVGENIRWYSDTSLTILVGTGNTFASGQTFPGNYIYYASQTISECESKAGTAILTINPLPIRYLGEDTTIFSDQNFKLGPFTDYYSYLWSNGSQNLYFEISGSDLGIGNHQISVMVSDTNNCNNSDTITVRVVPITDIHFNQNNNKISLFPNPSDGTFTIDMGKTYSNIEISITELDGRLIHMENFNNAKIINLEMNAEPGIYMVTITTANEKAVYKIMKE